MMFLLITRMHHGSEAATHDAIDETAKRQDAHR
jgi:hypothetical protein